MNTNAPIQPTSAEPARPGSTIFRLSSRFTNPVFLAVPEDYATEDEAHEAQMDASFAAVEAFFPAPHDFYGRHVVRICEAGLPGEKCEAQRAWEIELYAAAKAWTEEHQLVVATPFAWMDMEDVRDLFYGAFQVEEIKAA